MYFIREVFKAKPGKAKELVKKFKQAIPYFEKSEGGINYKVLTDITGNYWTVVVQYEIANIGGFFINVRGATAGTELQEIMKGYLDLVDGGCREVYLVE